MKLLFAPVMNAPSINNSGKHGIRRKMPAALGELLAC
jgi:hypothetical protein